MPPEYQICLADSFEERQAPADVQTRIGSSFVIEILLSAQSGLPVYAINLFIEYTRRPMHLSHCHSTRCRHTHRHEGMPSDLIGCGCSLVLHLQHRFLHKDASDAVKPRLRGGYVKQIGGNHFAVNPGRQQGLELAEAVRWQGVGDLTSDCFVLPDLRFTDLSLGSHDRGR